MYVINFFEGSSNNRSHSHYYSVLRKFWYAKLPCDRFVSALITNTNQERYKLDMDEGPERSRLQLRPNRDFYDTYEVMAPALPAASTAAPAAAGVAQEAAAADTQGAPPSSAGAVATTDDEPSASVAAAAMVTAVVTSPIVPSVAARAGSEVSPPAAGGAAAAAVAAAKSPDRPVPPPLSPSSDVASGGKSVVRGGGQVADIAALVRSMSVSVGVGGKGGPKRKQQLTSVFDLDDTDCSALLELEELRLEAEDAPDGAEDVSRGAAGQLWPGQQGF